MLRRFVEAASVQRMPVDDRQGVPDVAARIAATADVLRSVILRPG
jgi:hypothetical protein